MREKLELKIIALVVILLLIGVILAGIMVLKIQKNSLYSISESSSETTSQVIARDVQRTMLEGRADLTKDIVDDLKGITTVEEISVLNSEGREAFDETSPIVEGEVLKEILATKAPVTARGEKRLVFYKPLENGEKCRVCHADDADVLGAVKIAISLEKEYQTATNYIKIVQLATILACVVFSLILWMMIRRMVITPIKFLERAAQKLSEGDLSFDINIKNRDEIGRLSSAIKDSLFSISSILQRVKTGATQVFHVSEEVENESKKVVDGAMLETESITNISTSIEQMNVSISEIADGTDGLAASAEQTAASMEEMVTSITQIDGSTQELTQAVETTSTSIEELSATIKEVVSNTSELTAAAEETQAAINEISSTTKLVEQNAKESALLSEKVRNDAISFGMVSVEKTIEGMHNIKASFENTADVIKKLGGRSEEIGKILNVIDEVTDQTTLLALNAAILAAQAGEHGKGFSVVADEIKQLADRTSVSTQEIAVLIQSVQHEVLDAVAAMEGGLTSVETGHKVAGEAVDALRKIVESSKKSSDMAADISRATTEQALSTKLVTDAMETVLGMVGQISTATKEQNKGIQHIMRATDKMTEIAKQLRTATNEQSLNSRQISQAIEVVSDRSQQMSRAINEQKEGSNQIWTSLEKMKDIPKENKNRAFTLSQLLRQLHRDSELTVLDMEKFIFPEVATENILRMGVVPLERPAEMLRKFTPLARYLQQVVNRRIELKVATDFQSAVRDLGQNETQLCFLPPSSYIEARKQFGVKVLVEALRDGKPFQHAVIIARNDSAINSLEDIRGRSFAFGDAHSTSSHIMPRGMLLEVGIDLGDLSHYNYLSHRDDVAQAVLKGDFDAGGVTESTALKFKDRGLKIIKMSGDIAEFSICVSPSIDQTIVVQLRHALTSLSASTQEGAEVLKSIDEGYTGFVEAFDEDFNTVRTIMSELGIIS